MGCFKLENPSEKIGGRFERMTGIQFLYVPFDAISDFYQWDSEHILLTLKNEKRFIVEADAHYMWRIMNEDDRK